MKKRIHYTHPYLLNPTHPITVVLIGCGGTGCRVLTSLAMIDISLKALRHPGLYVFVYDGDRVELPNIGRQLFYECDLHLNKAVALVSRINRSFALSWKAEATHFTTESVETANIFISCVDDVQSRISIAETLHKLSKAYYSDHAKPMYWMDYGNMQKTGQVILGTLQEIKQPKSRKYQTVTSLPTIDKRFDLSQVNDKDSGPSCSHAQSLAKQDLFINTSLATLGSHILWELLREGKTEKAGLYLNLENLRSNPISV